MKTVNIKFSEPRYPYMGLIKKTLFSIYKRIIWGLDLIIPKNKHLFIYGCLADRYYDNPKYFFLFMKRNHPEIRSVWLTRKKELASKINQEQGPGSSYTFFSLKGIWVFLRAKVAIVSHGSIDFFYYLSTFSPKLIVNVWHGQPLKAIAYQAKYNQNKKFKLRERYDLFVVSSKIEAHTMHSAFKNHVKKTIITGQPRNDVLLQNLEKNPDEEIKRIKERLSLSFTPKHIILYAPTYRQGEPALFFPFQDLDFEAFDKLMKENQALIILRGHLNDLLKTSNMEGHNQLIKQITQAEWCKVLHQTQLEDINEIMHVITILITDYSGIYFDFLLTERPILFIPYDLEKYEKENGFLYPYETVTPGKKITSGKQFLDSLESLFNEEDKYKEHRKIITNLFMEVQTPKASISIFKKIANQIRL